MKVHTKLGAGLFEEVYKACLKHELLSRGLEVLSEVRLPVRYEGIQLEVGYRIDLMIERKVIVELKSVEKIASVHKAQLLTYLRLSSLQLGLLINFNTPHLKGGIFRLVNSPQVRR